MLVLLLAGCEKSGDDSTTPTAPATPVEPSYSVGGSMSGLTGAVILQNNGGNDLTISADGPFTFSTPLSGGSTYKVTILTQPAAQICSVSTGAGTLSGGDITNVAVVCAADAYNVSGTVSGLAGSTVLQNNGGNDLTVNTNGSFIFSDRVASSNRYIVTVANQPLGQSCSVANGTGIVAGANVTDVNVTCATNTYIVGGAVSGLTGSAVLQNNGGDNLTVSVNGAFAFSTAVASGSTYNVTVLTSPSGQTCTVGNGAGTIAGAVSIPTRHIHSVIEMAHKDDIRGNIDLLKVCVTNLDKYNWEFN